MKTVYVCDICGNQYDTQSECKACESEHILLLTSDEQVGVSYRFNKGDVFPSDIILLAPDGTHLVTYHGTFKGGDWRTKTEVSK